MFHKKILGLFGGNKPASEEAEAIPGELNYGFGELNPIRESDTFQVYDPQTATAATQLTNLVNQNYTPDILAGTGNYKGICLRTDKLAGENVAGSWVSSIFGDENPLLVVKVRIPELHAMLPDPLIGQVMDQKIINMYPSFVAADSNVSNDEPIPGDLVNVGFSDKINMTGPIFFGKVFSEPVGIAALVSGLGSFGKAKNKNPAKQAGPFLPDSNVKALAAKATKAAVASGRVKKGDSCIESEGLGEWCAWSKMNMLGELSPRKPIGGKSKFSGQDNMLGATAASAFKEMQAAASKAQNRIKVNSGFRSMPHQIHLKKVSDSKGGKPMTARPGKSNHQNGSAVDIAGTNDGSLKGKWGKPGYNTKLYLWLKAHAHEFGFVRSVNSESWHWLFVGKGRAPGYRRQHEKRYEGHGLEAWLAKQKRRRLRRKR